MPAKSKSQQKFMGMVHAVQKGALSPSDVSDKVKDAADQMDDSDAEDYASTKHDGKPEKVAKETLRKIQDAIRTELENFKAVDVDEGFGSVDTLDKKGIKEFEQWRKDNAEQLGYTLSGTSDVKEERDYKAEYKKFQSSTKSKKYRAELNQYNRKKGTYGNGDGKDASHKGGKIVGFETQSKNRGRAEKSRLKQERASVGDVGLGFLIDQLINSMEHYDEREFIKHMKQELDLKPQDSKKLWKLYWKLPPRKRMRMWPQEWEKVLKRIGITESINEAIPSEIPRTKVRLLKMNAKYLADDLMDMYKELGKSDVDSELVVQHLDYLKDKVKMMRKNVGLRESINEAKVLKFTDIKDRTLEKHLKVVTKKVGATIEKISGGFKVSGDIRALTSVVDYIFDKSIKKGVMKGGGMSKIELVNESISINESAVTFWQDMFRPGPIPKKYITQLIKKRGELPSKKHIKAIYRSNGNPSSSELAKSWKLLTKEKYVRAASGMWRWNSNFTGWESVDESTKEYSKTLDKIAKSIEAKKSISKKDRNTLMKIAKLMKRANESVTEVDRRAKSQIFREWNKFEKEYGNFFKAVVKLGKVNTKVTGDKTDEKIFLTDFTRNVGKFYSLMQSWVRGQKESVNEKTVQTLGKVRLSSIQKKAILIAMQMFGNMTGAVKKIEKLKKGLSNDKKVAAALQFANESINEAIELTKRCTVKEISTWLKTLEEFRYRKVRGVDARRVASFVNRGMNEEDLPISLQKKWEHRKYGREKHLAEKYLEIVGKVSVNEKISREEWSEYPKYARKLKPYLKRLLKIPVKVRVIKQANHNPWIDVRVARSGKDVIPNDFRKRALKAIGGGRPRDMDNITYGNITAGSVSLKHDEWLKLLGNKVR